MISSEKVLLRYIQSNDAQSIFSYRSTEQVARYQYWEPYTYNQAMEFAEKCSHNNISIRDQWIGLAIISISENDMIGDCAVKIGKNEMEIGCNISPKFQGKGFAKEALLLLFDYGFNVADVNVIYGITDSRNISSIKLMESLGMAKHPTFEERVHCKEEWSIEHKYVVFPQKHIILPTFKNKIVFISIRIQAIFCLYLFIILLKLKAAAASITFIASPKSPL